MFSIDYAHSLSLAIARVVGKSHVFHGGWSKKTYILAEELGGLRRRGKKRSKARAKFNRGYFSHVFVGSVLRLLEVEFKMSEMRFTYKTPFISGPEIDLASFSQRHSKAIENYFIELTHVFGQVKD